MRVLVADADVSTREAARRAVEQFGYRCVVAGDAMQAWECVLETDPDVVFAPFSPTDAERPNLIERTRSRPRASPPYLVAMVASDAGSTLHEAMESGADDFLIHPASPEELHARLQVAERCLLLQRQLGEAQAALERTKLALSASARADPLTGLGNRLQLNDDLDLFQGQLQRYGHRYAAIVVDLDRFQAFNDTHGSLAGDEALRVVAEVVSKQRRTGDRAYRYNGNQFVVLLPQQSADSTWIAAERIRQVIANLGVAHHENPPELLLTVSAGVAAFHDGEQATYSVLLGRAEAALARAKTAGRNRVLLDDGSDESAAMAPA